MNRQMHNKCDAFNIPFSHLWSTFWQQNHLFEANMLSLNSSGAAILAVQWHKLLTSSYPSRVELSTTKDPSTALNPQTTLNTSATPFIPSTIPTLQAVSTSNAAVITNETARKN